MKTRRLIAAILLLMGAQTLMAQEHVTNIRAKQEDKMVTIKYDLSTRSEVKLLISVDDGQHYTDTMKVTGMVDKIVPQGKNKVIRWQAFKDLGYGDYPEIRFKFITEEKQLAPQPKQIPNRTFVTLNLSCNNWVFPSNDNFNGAIGSLAPSIGITGGQVKKFGWFASIMTNFNFRGFSPDAVSIEDWTVWVDDETLESHGYTALPFYQKGAYSSLSIIGGGIMRLTDMFYLKAGLGYGHRSVSMKTFDGRWIRNKAYSDNGLDVDLGMMFNFNHFILSLDGVVGTNWLFNGNHNPIDPAKSNASFRSTPTIEARIGLGYSF